MTTNAYENFKTLEVIEKELKFMAKSIIRIKLLRSLENSTYTVKELSNDTGLCYSSVSTNLNKLEEKEYISKKDKRFSTKELTSLYLENLIEFDQTIEIIENFKELWNQHNIEELNQKAMLNLTSLIESELIKSTPLDIYKTHNILKDQLLNSKKIKLIFPYLHPEYPEMIKKSIENGANIELIIPKEIHDEFYYKLINNTDTNDQLIIKSSKNNLNIYLTITEEEMSLGLFKNDGSFDQNRILISNDKEALNWASELFKSINMKIKEEEKNEFN